MNFNDKKLPKVVKKTLLPRKEFLKQGKGRFLAVFDASPLGAQMGAGQRGAISWLAKVGVGVMAAIAIVSGVSVYADTQNVSTSSVLYPLKRLSENVRLDIAPPQARPVIQASLAARRATEIADLQEEQPSSTLINKLETDLDNDVSSSLTVAAQVKLHDGALGMYCGIFTNATTTAPSSSARVRTGFLSDSLMERFNEKCGADATDGELSDDTGTSTIAIGTSSTSTATSTKTLGHWPPVKHGPVIIIGKTHNYSTSTPADYHGTSNAHGYGGGDGHTNATSTPQGTSTSTATSTVHHSHSKSDPNAGFYFGSFFHSTSTASSTVTATSTLSATSTATSTASSSDGGDHQDGHTWKIPGTDIQFHF